MCLGTGGRRRGRTQRRARECVRMASVAKGQEDTSIPADPGSCSQAMAGSSSSWVEAAVCGSAAFGGLTVWLTFKSKTGHKEKGFFCARWWGRRSQGEWWATAEVGPYLQPPQKSSELCSLSLSLSLWKMVFQSCSSLPVLQCVGGLLYTAVKPMKTLLLCETSNGAKRAMLTGVTVNSHVWVAHIL